MTRPGNGVGDFSFPPALERQTLYASSVFSKADVEALLRDKRLKPPVASLYLNTDRTHAEGEKFLASFRHLVHRADKLLAHRTDAEGALARERLKQALPELLEFFDTEVAPQQVVRGVAMFVSLAEASDHDPRTPAFTAFTLPRPLRTQCALDRRPYIRPLLFLLDQYERVGVIVADRTHARIFTLFLGELESVERRISDTPQHHRRGGWKQMLFQRDIEGHLKAHIRSTVRRAVNVFGARPLKRIVLGGTDDTLGLMKRELPERLGSAVAGSFIAESHASDQELVTRALALAQAAERQEEIQRVADLQEALAHRPVTAVSQDRHGNGWTMGHRQAVHGAQETLQALSQQRVRLLLLRRGFHLPGSVCENCGSLFIVAGGSCPYCSHPLSAVPDVLEHAVERAEAERAEVEFVAESQTLEALGGIGALLRY